MLIEQMCGCATELDHAVYTMDCATSDKAAHELFVFGDIGGCVTMLSLLEQNDPGSMYIVCDPTFCLSRADFKLYTS